MSDAHATDETTPTDETKPGEDATPPGAAAATGSASPAPDRDRPRTRTRTMLVGGVVAVLIALVVALLLTRPSSRGGDESLEEARQVAVEFGAAYLTFDAASVDLADERMLALATDRFAAEFRSDRLPSVTQLFADSSTSTRAEVTETFLSPEVDGRLRVLVLVDVDATAATGSQQLVNLSFVIELVDDGTWKVDDVTPFPVPEVLGADASGATTTTPASPTTTATTTG